MKNSKNRFTNLKPAKAFLVLLAVILSLAISQSNAQAASVAKLSKSSVTIYAGGTTTLKVIGTKQKVTWHSSKKDIASVSNNGKVTAKKSGTTIITAKLNNKTFKCKVIVRKENIKINKTSATLYEGDTTTLKISGTSRKIIWSSSKTSVANVSKTGKVTAKKSGTATISAKVGNRIVKCKVTVKKYGLNESQLIFYTGNVISPGKEYVGQDYTDYSVNNSADLCLKGNYGKKTVTWASSNKSIATVTKTGRVFPKRPGTAIISAKVGGKTFKCKVYVKEIRLYFWMNLTDSESKLKSYWSWNDAFCLTNGETVRYKLLEREYGQNGFFLKETDITKKVKLTPQDPKTFSVNYKAGTITALQDDASDYSGYNIQATLTSHVIYGNGNNEKTKVLPFFGQSVQVLNFNVFPCKKAQTIDKISIGYDNLYEVDVNGSTSLYAQDNIDSNMGGFDCNDVFIPSVFWCFLSSTDEFHWSSNDENIVKIIETHGSGGNKGSISYLGRAVIRGLKPGYTSITLKYGNLIVDEVEILVNAETNQK